MRWNRNLLARLARLYPRVIISGRARYDVLDKLRGVKVARVIGNHGAEMGSGIREWRSAISRWKKAGAQTIEPVFVLQNGSHQCWPAD